MNNDNNTNNPLHAEAEHWTVHPQVPAATPAHPEGIAFIGGPAAIAKLCTQLAAAQAEFAVLGKRTTGQVGNQRFRYAGIAQIIASVRPALACGPVRPTRARWG